jgi:2-methylcitrate dehydratase PrpD
MRPGITEQLASYVVAESFERLDRSVVERAKLCLLDFITAACCGWSESMRMVLGLIEEFGGREESSIIGSNMRAPCANAALANGILVHASEFDDCYELGAPTHVGNVVIPAALALAEREEASGRDLITSIVVGYEVACRIAKAVGRSHYDRWHATGTCGTFGAAASAGKLLNLSKEEMINSLGLAGTQAAGLWEFLADGAIQTKHLHAGKASFNGVISALLAKKGFRGPSKILEGERGFCRIMSEASEDDIKGITEGLGESYEGVMKVSFKRYPCCFACHGPIELALRALQEVEEIDSIKEIRVITNPAAASHIRWMVGSTTPKDGYEAKFSAPFTIAIALTDGYVGPWSFNESNIKREEIKELMRKIQIVGSTEIETNNKVWGIMKLEVETNKGTIYQKSIKREEILSMSEREVESKFFNIALKFIGEEKAKFILNFISKLDDVKNLDMFFEVIRSKLDFY